MIEFELMNDAFVESVQKFCPTASPEIILEQVSENEYQAMACGWFLAKGLPVPEDCSKATNCKVKKEI